MGHSWVIVGGYSTADRPPARERACPPVFPTARRPPDWPAASPLVSASPPDRLWASLSSSLTRLASQILTREAVSGQISYVFLIRNTRGLSPRPPLSQPRRHVVYSLHTPSRASMVGGPGDRRGYKTGSHARARVTARPRAPLPFPPFPPHSHSHSHSNSHSHSQPLSHSHSRSLSHSHSV